MKYFDIYLNEGNFECYELGTLQYDGDSNVTTLRISGAERDEIYLLDMALIRNPRQKNILALNNEGGTLTALLNDKVCIPAGSYEIQLRTAGDRKYHSNTAMLKVDSAINAADVFPEKIYSEIRQIEEKILRAQEEAENAVQSAKDAAEKISASAEQISRNTADIDAEKTTRAEDFSGIAIRENAEAEDILHIENAAECSLISLTAKDKANRDVSFSICGKNMAEPGKLFVFSGGAYLGTTDYSAKGQYRILPATSYRLSTAITVGDGTLFFYDENGNQVKAQSFGDGSFTSPENSHTLGFYIGSSVLMPDKEAFKVQLEIGSEQSSYEAFKSRSGNEALRAFYGINNIIAPEAVIECEYAVDTKLYIESRLKSLLSSSTV